MKHLSKKTILSRLEGTIKNLEELPDENFHYASYIDEWDKTSSCGTVCCVAGWYPRWFPESGFIYYKNILLGNEPELRGEKGLSGDIASCLTEYHGLNYNLINILFYGGLRSITQVVGKEEELFGLIVSEVLDSSYLAYNLLPESPRTINKIGLEWRDGSSKEDVLKIFKLVYQLVEKDLIQYR